MVIRVSRRCPITAVMSAEARPALLPAGTCERRRALAGRKPVRAARRSVRRCEVPGSYVVPCWCLGAGLTAAVEAAVLEREEAVQMERQVLIGSGVNEALAREAEAADLAEAEEARQRAVDLALSEEDPRPLSRRGRR